MEKPVDFCCRPATSRSIPALSSECRAPFNCACREGLEAPNPDLRDLSEVLVAAGAGEFRQTWEAQRLQGKCGNGGAPSFLACSLPLLRHIGPTEA